MDPQQRILLEVSQETLAAASLRRAASALRSLPDAADQVTGVPQAFLSVSKHKLGKGVRPTVITSMSHLRAASPLPQQLRQKARLTAISADSETVRSASI